MTEVLRSAGVPEAPKLQVSVHDRTPFMDPLIVAASALTAVAFVWRWPLLHTRWFDPDEFQHLHAAWYVSQGFLPFRDFFEHHMPLIYLVIAPLYSFFDVGSNSDDAVAFLFVARRCMWLFMGVAFALVAILGATWRDARVGMVGMLFLANTLMFLEKTVEIRPDPLALMFWLACLLGTLHAVRSRTTDGGARWWFFASGALLAAGILTTQKLLFALPGFGLAMLWHLLDPRSSGTLRRRLEMAGWQLIGFTVPMALMLGFFALSGALREFIQYNLLLNVDWSEVRFSPAGYLKQLVVQNPELVALGVVGTMWTIVCMFRRHAFLRGDYIIALPLVGFVAGLFIIPVPYRQYYVTFLPLFALMAARTLVDGLDTLRAIRQRMPWASWQMCGALAFVVTAVAMYPALRFALSSPTGWRVAFVIMWLGAALCVATAFTMRAEALAAALFVLALSAYPFQQMHAAFARTNVQQLKEVKYILENTSPSETVMDGWSGLGVFRPHAYRYHFLHDEARAMLTDTDRASLLEGLRSGEIAPSMIILDRDLRRVSPEITAYLTEHYEPTNVGAIWRRRTDVDGRPENRR